MRNLIKADMQRILRKKSIWLAFIFMIAIVAGEILYKVNVAPDRNLGFAVAVSDSIGYVGLVLGIILVLNIYADDFKASTYINIVGHGISRLKYIITKYLDAMIILVGIYACAGVLVLGLQAGLGVTLSSLEISFVFWRFVSEIIYAAAGISVASLCFFITENSAIGVLAFLGIELVIPVALEFVRTNPTVVKYHLDRIYLYDICSSMLSDFLMRQTGAGLLKLILVITVYVIAAIVGSIIYFRKKELDF